jgi:hypothetical protein
VPNAYASDLLDDVAHETPVPTAMQNIVPCGITYG